MEWIKKAAPASEIEVYVCPACKRHLRHESESLRCDICSREFAINHGIPNSSPKMAKATPILRE